MPESFRLLIPDWEVLEAIEPMSVKEGAKVTKYRFHLTIFSHREVEKLSTKNKHNERLCEDVVMRLYDEKMKGWKDERGIMNSVDTSYLHFLVS